MAVYCISDIHGALKEFRRLLEKTEFRLDGSDSLYLLGDYCDWGEEPLEALCHVMELDRKYPFVHCLIGNHEQMFLDTVRLGKRDPEESGAAQNWFWNNRGIVTWNEYQALPEEKRREIAAWMASLPYSASVAVNGKKYFLGHAFPYFYDVRCGADEESRRRADAVWRRLMIREDPFGLYEGREHYDIFICGHTITDYYFHKLQYEKRWPYRKPDPSVRNRIFHAEKFIDIDCGAKCFACGDDLSPALRRGAERAQLAAIRLDDGREFYVHPAVGRVQQMMPDVKLPQVKMPDVKLPQVKMPDMKLPQVKLPEMPNKWIHRQ